MRFGYSWVTFAAAVAVHVADEAIHDFLTVYNATALQLRAFIPFIPVFTFDIWLGGLIAGIALLLLLSPLAFKGDRRLGLIAIPLGLVIGMFNGIWHVAASIYMGRFMPGVYSAPLLFAAGLWLLLEALRLRRAAR